jgi:1,4-dihydroxy-2-naphthoyl-CoA hydrolase
MLPIVATTATKLTRSQRTHGGYGPRSRSGLADPTVLAPAARLGDVYAAPKRSGAWRRGGAGRMGLAFRGEARVCEDLAMREEAPIDFRGRTPKVPLEESWSGTVGFEYWVDDDGETLHGRLPLRARVCQPMGLVHGGIYACVAEELASVGTARAVMDDGRWCVGMSNLTHFLRSARLGGTLTAVARALHRGRTTWVWDVDMHDENGRRCAKSTVTMAVREGPPPE